MLDAVGFNGLVVLSAVGLSIVFLVLLGAIGGRRTDEPPVPRSWSAPLIVLSSLLLGALAFYSANLVGPRPPAWFALQIATCLSLWLASLVSRSRVVVVLSAGLVAVSGFSILQALGTGVAGEDQWRDLAAEYFALAQGNLDQARDVMGGYYTAVPLLPTLMPVVSLVTGLDLLSANAVVAPIFVFVGALALMLLAVQATGFSGAAVLVAAIILSSPRLSLWLLLHQTSAAALAAIALLMIHRSYLSRGRNWSTGASLCLVLIVFALNATHVSGSIAVVTFGIAGAVALSGAVAFDKSESWLVQATRIRWLLTALVVVMVAYWLYTQMLDFLAHDYLRAFIQQFLQPRGELYREPFSDVVQSRVVALGWAFPVALTLVFVLRAGLLLLPKLRRKLGGQISADQLFAGAIGVGAIVLLAAGFGTILVRGSEGSFERYLSVPSYLVMTVPAAATAGLIVARGRVHSALFSLVIVAMVAVGSASIEWAPDVQPSSGVTTRSDYRTAFSLFSLVPVEGRFGAVKGIDSPLSYEFTIHGVRYLRADEYRTTVEMQRDVAQGVSEPPPVEGSDRPFVIVESYWLSKTPLPKDTSIVYSGGDYVVLVPDPEILAD